MSHPVSVASLGDLDGDGIGDLAVGAYLDDTGGIVRGAVHVLFLNADGTAKSTTKIASGTVGGPTLVNGDYFGSSVASLGDLDGDGMSDLAVGAVGDATGGFNRGAVHVLFLNADGTAKSTTKIASGTAGGPTLANNDRFGGSVASLGDLDGDGIGDLAVGANGDDTGGYSRGALHVLFLNADGTAKSTTRIASGTGGAPTLADGDFFGRSVASLGDLDGDGMSDLAVGAFADDTGGNDRGAVHVLFLSADGTAKRTTKIASGIGGGPTLVNADRFGVSVASLGDLDGDGVSDLAVGAFRDDTGGSNRGAVHVLFMNPSLDFGDAPDTGPGTGTGNYNTLLADNGPVHSIVAGLFMGAGVDGEADALPNAAASGDDINLPDDEDGLNNLAADLTLTVGAQPTVNVFVTNTTGSTATLFGWIDTNADGVFDNTTERASVAVLNSIGQIVTLVFPAVPLGFTGTTYARFRLSTDAAAANSTGFAIDGEVEDYTATITFPGDGTAGSTTKIASGTGGGPALVDVDLFGMSVALLGDLDGDGISDLAVGAPRDDTGGTDRGAVHVLFLNADGTTKSTAKIASGIGGGPTLADADFFGRSVASLGDLDGDGIGDVAVGAYFDDTGGSARGAVYVLFLNADGTAKSTTKIASGIGGGPTLVDGDFFGISVALLGDLDGDGIGDLAVGAYRDDTGGFAPGAVHVLFLNADGTAKSTTKIASGTGGGPTLVIGDRFGRSVASLGDLDGDGIGDLAVGALRDDTGGTDRGAVHVLFLNADGTAKSTTKIASGTGGGPTLVDVDLFGSSVSSLGDLDGDGVSDLAIGAVGDATGGSYRGAVHVLFMNAVVNESALLFTATRTDLQRELFVSDGTAAGTRVLKNLGGIVSADPQELTPFGNKVVFSAARSDGQRELFITDATTVGTVLLANLASLTSSNPGELTAFGSQLLFAATRGNGQRELFVSDGTTAGTGLLANLSGPTSSDPQNLTVFGSQVFFTAMRGNGQRELFVSDGTVGGTGLLVDLSGTTSSDPQNFTPFGNQLLFTALTSTGERELFVSDGTAGGTGLLADMSGTTASDPQDLTVVGSQVYFTALLAGGTERELHVTDGTGAGTGLVKDLSGSASSNPGELTAFNGQLYFAAISSGGQRELYSSDGTVGGTGLLKNLGGATSADPGELTVFAGDLYFAATSSAGQRELYSSDGTGAGTALFKNLVQANSVNPTGLTVFGNQLFFNGTFGDGQQELFVSDGTVDGTSSFKNLAKAVSSNPANFTVLGSSALPMRVYIGARENRESERVTITEARSLTGVVPIDPYRKPSIIAKPYQL